MINTNLKTKTVNALLALHKIGEAMQGPREAAKAETAILSSTFLTMLHASGATETNIKASCKAIFEAVKVKLGNPDMPEGELAGAWRQYKSDTCKAARLTELEPKVRATLTTMSAVKKFIGTANDLGVLVAMVQAFTYHSRKMANKEVHATYLAELLKTTATNLRDYAEKFNVSLVAPPKNGEKEQPIIKAATKPAKKRDKKKAAPMADIAEQLPAALQA